MVALVVKSVCQSKMALFFSAKTKCGIAYENTVSECQKQENKWHTFYIFLTDSNPNAKA